MIGAIIGPIVFIFVALLVYFCWCHRTTGKSPTSPQVAALTGAAAAAAPTVLGAAEEGRVEPLTNPMRTGPRIGSTPQLRAAAYAPYSRGIKGFKNPMSTKKGGQRMRTRKQKGGNKMSDIFAIAGPLTLQILANGGNFNLPDLISKIMTML